ncbi:MAG: CinA family protein, partial [Hyphomicrobium sp.]
MSALFPVDLVHDAEALLAELKRLGFRLATVESCTGGLLAGLLTEIAGSSAVFERGFVTYSNSAKSELIGVPPALLERHGAVSEEVARAMAEGALAHAPVDVAVSVTGIAGPD